MPRKKTTPPAPTIVRAVSLVSSIVLSLSALVVAGRTIYSLVKQSSMAFFPKFEYLDCEDKRTLRVSKGGSLSLPREATRATCERLSRFATPLGTAANGKRRSVAMFLIPHRARAGTDIRTRFSIFWTGTSARDKLISLVQAGDSRFPRSWVRASSAWYLVCLAGAGSDKGFCICGELPLGRPNQAIQRTADSVCTSRSVCHPPLAPLIAYQVSRSLVLCLARCRI